MTTLPTIKGKTQFQVQRETLEFAATLAKESAEQYARQARGGDNSGASDHMETAALDIESEIRAHIPSVVETNHG